MQDLFQAFKCLLSRDKIRNFPKERFSLLACIVTPRPAVIRTVYKQWVDSYHGYHIIWPLCRPVDRIAARNVRVFLEKCIPFSR